MKCGASEVVITPKLGSPIPGSVSDRLSDGVKDDLYAKAIVWETDGQAAAIVALDAIDVPRRVVQQVRERAHRQIGIAVERIMVSCTHTHTGGPTIRTSYVAAVDEAYLDYVVERAADAVCLAWSRRVEVRIGCQRGHEAGIAFNRRFRMADGTVRMNPGIRNPDIVKAVGPIDPEVLVVRIDDLDGRPVAVVTNYACHACVVGGSAYSADFPGELSVSIKRMLGENVVSVFLQGASGDINHIDTSGTFPTSRPDHYKRMGRILAGEAIKVREKAEPLESLELRVESATVPIRFRRPSGEQVTAARKLLEQSVEATKVAERKMATQIIEMAEENGSDGADAEVQVIALGKLAIVGLPAEQFVAFGLQLKAASPFPYTLINQLTNGSVSGYVCTREAYRQGGYETMLRPYSKLQEEAGELLADCAQQLLAEMGTDFVRG